MTAPTDEREVLRAAIRQTMTDGEVPDSFADRIGSVDWHRVLWLARQHSVLLFLQRVLGAPRLAELVPREIQTQLRDFHEVCRLRALARARAACLLLDDFERLGIPAINLDRWPASMGGGRVDDLIETGLDLNFLVPAADTARARSLVGAAGHRTELAPEKLLPSGNYLVKLNPELGQHAEAGRFWNAMSACLIGGRTFRRLDPAHGLILLASPEAASAQPRLARAAHLVDMARQISPEGWTTVLAEAAVFGATSRVFRAVSASYRALDLPLPAALATACEPDATVHHDTGRENDPPPPEITVPYLPTPPVVVRRMLELAAAGPDDVVCDLGCGDGRIAIQAAADFGARSFGIDCDPDRVAEAVARATARGVQERVAFASGDLFSADLAEATVVTCYLLPQLMPALAAKLRREARRGTRVVSHDYIFPGWPPERTEIIRTNPLKISQIYLWRIE